MKQTAFTWQQSISSAFRSQAAMKLQNFKQLKMKFVETAQYSGQHVITKHQQNSTEKVQVNSKTKSNTLNESIYLQLLSRTQT
jgi:hypothetical protein